MKSFFRLTVLAALLFYLGSGRISFSQTTSNVPDWMSRPLSVLDAVNEALQQNATILKAQNDLTASFGLVVQTRAVALPQLTASGQYKIPSLPPLKRFLFREISTGSPKLERGLSIGPNYLWRRQTPRRNQGSAAHQRTGAGPISNRRPGHPVGHATAYYDALLAREQITVHEASVKLLQNERDDQQRRYKAGTVPEFNVLRAEVQLANERPLLIQARNSFRIAKNNLSNLLGYNLPRDVWEDMPMNLSDKLDAAPYHVDLPSGIAHGIETRSELVALRKRSRFAKTQYRQRASPVTNPLVQVFAGYNWFNAQYAFDAAASTYDQKFQGYDAGAQVSWDIFDGMLTHGKVVQARAELR